jgi:hypothetical protein
VCAAWLGACVSLFKQSSKHVKKVELEERKM